MAKHAEKQKLAAAAARDYQRNRHLLRKLCILLIVVIAFVAGFALRSQEQFLSNLGFDIPGFARVGAQSPDGAKTTYNSASARLSELEDVLSESGLSGYDLDAATAEVLAAFSASVDDSYFEYLDQTRYSAYVKESSDGAYTGVGVLFSDYNGRAVANDVFTGSSAQAAGVMQGDVVVAIDGDASHSWSVSETLSALSKQEGETVVVTWMRPASEGAETGEQFTTVLTCSVYNEENVSSSMQDSNVGWIKVRQMTQNTSDAVSAAITALAGQGATSYVLDLRDNPGGYLTQAVGIANLFLKTGVVVEVKTASATSTKSAAGTTVTDAPLVVLVNGYTSGAAEVLAAALQDNQRATVVGETTMGKGSVQVVHELSFGGAVRYTAAYYISPSGHDIDGVGVIPDLSVPASTNSTDSQLLQAVDTAQSKVSG